MCSNGCPARSKQKLAVNEYGEVIDPEEYKDKEDDPMTSDETW
jgi:hypothetical protein